MDRQTDRQTVQHKSWKNGNMDGWMAKIESLKLTQTLLTQQQLV